MVDILLVEDCVEVGSIIQGLLNGFCGVKTVNSIASAQALLLKNKYDLIIIDLNLSDGSGLNLATKIKDTTPFLFLSGDTTNESQLAALQLGAEDYIMKPFNHLILRAKVLNCIKRHQNEIKDLITLGNLELHSKEMKAYIKGPLGNLIALDLTTLEYRLLSVFIQHKNQALTRTNIIDLVWSESTYITDRVVDQHIFFLRQKIAGSLLQIKSIYGHGYRLEVQSPA